ncbi:MAG TPA: ABC transporter permease [Gemmatimonadales bacterium]|nr:ABC transporter permease [Gemmatimonadales bacterium]
MPALVPSVVIGLKALGANPVRTALSTLGVVMGVAALVAVLALGDGLERYARDQIARTTSIQAIEVSSRTTTVLDGQRIPITDYPVFTEADGRALAEAVPLAREVRLTVVGGGRIRLPGSDSLRGASVMGVAAWPAMESPPLAAGRFLDLASPADSQSVVVSHPLAAALAAGGPPASAVGRPLRIEDRDWRVAGILASGPAEGGFAVMLPAAKAAMAMAPAGAPRLPLLLLTVARVEDVEAAKSAVEAWLETRTPSWKERTIVATSLGRARQARQGMLLFKLLMGAITGISLLVGGIGIMNVLLASVTERTREIGIRKAVGARRRDIMTQFLAESIAITGVGSLAGILLGLGGAYAVTALMRARTEALVFAGFSWSSLLVATLAGAAVGVGFGTYPALRAGRLSPIDAIRHE